MKCTPLNPKKLNPSSLGYFKPGAGAGFFSSFYLDEELYKDAGDFYVPLSSCKHGTPATSHYWCRSLSHYVDEVEAINWLPIRTAPRRRMILARFNPQTEDSVKGGFFSQTYFREFTPDEKRDWDEFLLEDAMARGRTKPRRMEWWEYGVWSVPEQEARDGSFTREPPAWGYPLDWAPLPPYPE